jgi:tetraacyldisaccharide 4'-kinase
MPAEPGLDDLELYLLEVMEGRRRGFLPEILRILAAGAAGLYGLGVRLRLALYARGLLRRRRAPLPVISVGNLTVGGTGKTPFVAYLAKGLIRQGHRPAVLARGYRAAQSTGLNDEMEMLSRQCPEALLTVGPNRLAGSHRASKGGADVAVLDDGFQHVALERDLDILLIDATRPFGNGRLVPRGQLREPPENASRADAVVLTRVDLAKVEQLGELRTWLGRIRPGMPLIECAFRPRQLRGLTEAVPESLAPEALSGRRVAAFAALAEPRSFGRTLRTLGAEVVYSRRFPDHHRYAPSDLVEVAAGAAAARADLLITTEKDAVKLEDLPAPDLPLHCLTIEAELERGEDLLWAEIGRALSSFPGR